MPLFEYKAVSPSGETVRGTMEAVSEDSVIAKLQESGNIPLSANAAGKGGFSLDSLSLKRRGMNAREVGQFTQQLATLLGAGLPLDRSLHVLLDLAENERIKQTVSTIRDAVREGGSLHSMVHSVGFISIWCVPVKSAAPSIPHLIGWQITSNDPRILKTVWFQR